MDILGILLTFLPVIAILLLAIYLIYRVLAWMIGLLVRISRASDTALAAFGLGLAALGLASIGVAFATVDSCDHDALTPFLTSTGAAFLALASARHRKEPSSTRRVTQAMSFASLTVGLSVAGLALAGREVAADRAQTVGDLRTIVSGEMAYASANGGFFDHFECLLRPSGCIAAYPSDGPLFLDSWTASDSRLGYARRFYPGPGAPPDRIREENLSASSLTSWAFVAVPSPRARGRCDSFCTDSTGRICFLADGSEPRVVEGRCDEACTTLP
jgi:hypothetical protein